jgi:hypothetical protein
MSLREAAQQALEALEERYVGALRDKAMDALRTALAEPDPAVQRDLAFQNMARIIRELKEEQQGGQE